MHYDIRQFVAQGRLEGSILDARADQLNVEIQRGAGVGYGYFRW